MMQFSSQIVRRGTSLSLLRIFCADCDSRRALGSSSSALTGMECLAIAADSCCFGEIVLTCIHGAISSIGA
jgi:hypothetical protein